MTRLPELSAATSHTYFSHRLRLHYLDWGNDDAEPLLLIHGSQDHCHSWDTLAQAFRDDFHVIAPDLRGHGDSAWAFGSSYASMEYVYDIAQLVRQLQLERVTIVAHSMGGSLALKYAGIYPEKVKRLVVIEGVGLWWSEQWLRFGDSVHEALRNWIDSVRDTSARLPRRYPTLEAAYERMHQQNSHLSEEQARHLTQHGALQNEDGSYSWKFDNYTRTWTPFDMPADVTRGLWGRITCPILLVNARQGYEHRTGQDGTLELFQNAHLVDIDDAGHWLHHDQPEQFIDQLRRFVSETRAPGG